MKSGWAVNSDTCGLSLPLRAGTSRAPCQNAPLLCSEQFGLILVLRFRITEVSTAGLPIVHGLFSYENVEEGCCAKIQCKNSDLC